MRDIFGTDSAPVFVSNSPVVLQWAREHGYEAQDLDAVLSYRPAAIVFVPTSWPDVRVRQRALVAAFSTARTLTVPIAAFGDSEQEIRYTLDQLCESDFPSAVRAGHRWHQRLRQCQGMLKLRGAHSEAMLNIDVDNLSWRARSELEPGEPASIGDYCEAELECPFSTAPKFALEGTLAVTSMLVGRGAVMPRECYGKYENACRLRERALASRQQVRVELRDSRVVGFHVGKADCLDELNELTNDAYALSCTELAFGLNLSVGSSVNWTLNSALNEGVGVMHFALGDSISGAHIHFICDDLDEWSPIFGRWQPLQVSSG